MARLPVPLNQIYIKLFTKRKHYKRLSILKQGTTSLPSWLGKNSKYQVPSSLHWISHGGDLLPLAFVQRRQPDLKKYMESETQNLLTKYKALLVQVNACSNQNYTTLPPRIFQNLRSAFPRSFIHISIVTCNQLEISESTKERVYITTSSNRHRQGSSLPFTHS
jgi:hypothetical protein